MKKILILLIILAVLIGAAAITKSNRTKQLSVAASREKLIDKLDTDAIRKIVFKDGDKTATIAAVGDTWAVAERSNYPAAYGKLSKAIQDLVDQKAGTRQPIGKSAWGEVKLLAPGEGDAAKTGFAVQFMGEGDKPLKTLVLGVNVESSKVGEAKSPFGGGGNQRYARLTDDGDTVWVVGNQFYDLQAKPEDWIDKSFFTVEKIKSVDVVAPKAEESWKASRKAETDNEFTLEGGKADEGLDNIKAGLSNLLSSPSFNDVLPKDKATADFMKDATKVTITTFDGFTYKIQWVKKGEASNEKYYMTVDTSADLPKERPAVKDEKPEDKKKADEEFAKKKTALEEHLAKDKKAAGWVYEVSSYTLGSLNKKKAELLKAPATPGETNKDGSSSIKASNIPGTSITPAVPAMPAPAKPAPPKPPVSVTTPPVAAPPVAPPTPPVQKMEVKPTPPSNANPATGQPTSQPPAPAKPATEAPKPATPPAEAPKPAAPPADAPKAPTPPVEAPKPATPPAPAPEPAK